MGQILGVGFSGSYRFNLEYLFMRVRILGSLVSLVDFKYFLPKSLMPVLDSLNQDKKNIFKDFNIASHIRIM